MRLDIRTNHLMIGYSHEPLKGTDTEILSYNSA
jgi:hypothetical protein